MKNDFERRVEILADILQGKKKNKAEYAFEHGVAEITISRDLRWFRDKSIPIYSKNGKVVIDGRIPKSKINRVLAEYISVKLNAEFYLENINTFSKSHPYIFFQNLVNTAKAVGEKRLINIRYKRITDNEEVNYNVKPVKLLLSGYNWIMHAVKENENLVKMFYLTRIKSIKLLNKYFEINETKQESTKRYNIKLKFAKSVRNQLTDKIWFAEFEITEDEEGNIILETEQQINNSLAAWCISWWDQIEILEPDSLKKYISEMIKYYNRKNS